MSPARRVLGYLRPCAARYGVGVVRLALATAHFETLSPAFYLTHRTGDLMSPGSA